MGNKLSKNLQKLLDVNIPVIYIDDYDYTRVDEIIKEACGKNVKIKEWNPASGYTNFKTKESKSKNSLQSFLEEMYACDKEGNKKETYLVLRDISNLVNEPVIVSLISHIAQRKLYDRNYETSVIISDFGLQFPQKLLPYVSILNVEMPDDEEINKQIEAHLEANESDVSKFSDHSREVLMLSLRGLTRFEIDRVLDMAMSVNGSLGDEDRELILQQKKAQVRKSGLVDLVDVKEKPEDIGGLEGLKSYLTDKSVIMKHLVDASKNNISIPKGVFIVGMPGCGKSLCAKAAAAQFDCPLLKLDMGSMMGKYQGESEANLRRAIQIAESAAPCILWIDEIEKGFAGVGGANDSMTRMFGYFLSWMQDKTSSVYVIATANNADNLPPELKRKGRFDEIFCVHLPNQEERKAIFDVHLSKRNQKISDLSKIVKKTDGFNGADIESVINEALEKAFIKQLNDNKEGKSDINVKLTEKELLEVADRAVSISKSCKKQIDKMVEIFKDSNFKNASEKV